MNEPRHCDDYIRDKTQPKALRKFLLYKRIPAYWQADLWKDSWGFPVLYADYNGERVRVVMASRFGDVGITKDLTKEHGYETRVSVEELTNFSEEP
jgi:hypothetical protein